MILFIQGETHDKDVVSDEIPVHRLFFASVNKASAVQHWLLLYKFHDILPRQDFRFTVTVLLLCLSVAS
jgi:hypothetical protein